MCTFISNDLKVCKILPSLYVTADIGGRFHSPKSDIGFFMKKCSALCAVHYSSALETVYSTSRITFSVIRHDHARAYHYQKNCISQEAGFLIGSWSIIPNNRKSVVTHNIYCLYSSYFLVLGPNGEEQGRGGPRQLCRQPEVRKLFSQP